MFTYLVKSTSFLLNKLQFPYVLFYKSHLFKHFYEKKSFSNYKANFSFFNIFFLYFNSSPPHKSKRNNMKWFANSKFFNLEAIKNHKRYINSGKIRKDYFILIKISFRRKTYKFKLWSWLISARQ